jgi:hypothetical protein
MVGTSQSTGVSIFVSLFAVGLLQGVAMLDADEDFAAEYPRDPLRINS